MYKNYPILCSEDTVYQLAKRAGGVVKEFRRLQATTNYYSDSERYQFAKLFRIKGVIESEEPVEGKEGMVKFELADPEIDAHTFLNLVAQLLFPSAGIDESKFDDVDHEHAIRALEAFENFITPTNAKPEGLSALLTHYQNEATLSTTPAAQEVPEEAT